MDDQDLLIGIGICLLLGILAAFITLRALTAGLRSVRARREASGYEDAGSFMLTGQRDTFAGRRVERFAKPKQTKH